MGIAIKDTENLKRMIISQGYSQNSFSKHTGISQTQITNLINGRRNPGPEVAKTIADALDMAFEDLFDIT